MPLAWKAVFSSVEGMLDGVFGEFVFLEERRGLIGKIIDVVGEDKPR